jgi:hypothetical protein
MPDLLSNDTFLTGLASGVAAVLVPSLVGALVANRWFQKLLTIANAMDKGEIQITAQAARKFIKEIAAKPKPGS